MGNKVINDIEVLNLKDYNDAYFAIGRIIENTSFWEEELKQLCIDLKYNVNSYDFVSIRRMINILFKDGHILEIHKNRLLEVVELRNYYVHQFFIDFHKASIFDYDEISKKISKANHLIFESRDFIQNKIDEANGINLARRATEIEDK